jgi:hypothetical protein
MNLPPDVDCLTDAQLFIWRPRGVLDADKTNQILAFVTEQETKFGRSFNRFTDLSALDAVDLTFKYVFQVALYRRLSRQGQETIKSAFFVTNPEAAHYMRLHAVLTDHSPLKVALFKEREAAAKWLGVSSALLAPK